MPTADVISARERIRCYLEALRDNVPAALQRVATEPPDRWVPGLYVSSDGRRCLAGIAQDYERLEHCAYARCPRARGGGAGTAAIAFDWLCTHYPLGVVVEWVQQDALALLEPRVLGNPWSGELNDAAALEELA